MAQMTLEECIASARQRQTASEQTKQLARVTSRIGLACLGFAREHLGREFRGEALLAWCRNWTGKNVAPDSPRRVMSELEAQGHVRLELISRAGSLYRVVEVSS